MEIAMGFNSLMTTTNPPNINLPSSGQHVTAQLSAHKAPGAPGDGAQKSLVKENKELQH